MTQWWNGYLGIPYVANGRERAGLDCWGLVRLVHAEVLGNTLPSFADQYVVSERDKTAELIALNKESWVKVDVPQSGDVALFRILGEESHVGIITRPGYFLHVREGQDSVIERLDSSAWKHRLAGVYRYAASEISVSAVPHPLRTVRLDAVVPAGTTLAKMAATIRAQAEVDETLPDNAAILIDGEYIPRSEWETLVPQVGQRVEYRALVRGSGIGRMVGMVALMAFAWWAAPAIVGLGGINLAAAVGSTGISLLTSVAQGAIVMAGSLLLNAIFPVRSATAADNSPRSMNLLQGGSNQLTRYGAIPVVLGRMRYTPPLAAETYVESGSSKSYLYMVVLWGYGPLQVSDLRIGTTPIDTYEEIEYETLNGWDDTAEDKARFNSIYGRDVTQELLNVKLSDDVPVERTILEEVDRIKVTFNFPQGLYAVDPTYGKEYSRRVWVSIKIKPTGSGSYAEVAQTVHGRVINLSSAYYNIDSDAELEPVYRWTRFSLDKYNNVITRTGAFTKSAYAEPSGTLLARLRAETYGQNTTYDRLPALGAGEEALWDVCIHGGAVYATVDRRGNEGYGSVTGCALTTSGLKATLASGTIMRSQNESFVIEKKIKRAFCVSSEFYVPRGQYDVMVTRTTGTPGGDNTTYDDCNLFTITGYANNKPITPPASMAMTAIRVKATDQLNGTIDGITGTVQAIGLDYDRTTGTWIKRATRNPASLFRHVLQHPGNARRVPDSQINLTALADWHEFCRSKGFMFDFVLTGQVSLDDMLRDICAAGRASPTRVDGKHTVIIDRPRSEYAQFFTPHNSWGFESTKALPVIPHGFRVIFTNAARGYQVDERIVYDDDYSAANATLFEALSLPGVSDEKIVHKHARHHLAQIKLRPETYTLNADWEHLVCTRGDLVKVTHDVPMWGFGSGRIKEFIDGTHLKIDEDFPMDAGQSYCIRIRLENGTSIVRNIVPASVDGHYDTLTLTASVTSTQGKAGNLVMFGLLDAESADFIVQSIEPSENLCARLTLVDYSPAIYDSDTHEIPAFNSQITLPPTLLIPTVTQTPTITGVVSDERAMTRLSVGKYQYGMRVGFANPTGLPKAVTHIEGQMEWAEDNTTDWQTSQLVPIAMGAVTFQDVEVGDTYKLRLRYVDKDGRTGPWSAVRTHTVVGKVNPPSTVTGLTVAVSGTKLLLDWAANPEPDVEQYEVRAENANWGQAGYLFRGAASQCLIMPPAAGESKTFYVKAIDGGKLYSSTAASVSYTYAAPSAPSSLTYSFHDTSTTTATVTLDWSDVVSAFGTKDYLVSWGETTKAVGSSTIKLRVDWTGSRTFSVQTRDQRGSVSAAKSITITLQLPGTPPAPKQDITQGNGMLLLVLDWADAAKGSLPVGGYEIRSADSGWGGSGYLYRGSASQATIANVLSKLAQTWYLKSYDTDGRYCATARTFVVEEPGVPPSVVGLAVNPSGTRLALDWSDSSALDVTRYEVRTEDADWGSAGGSRVYYGGSSNCYFSPTETGTYTFYVKARDAVGRWSVSAASVIAVLSPPNVGAIASSVSGKKYSLSFAVPASTFPVAKYEIRYGDAFDGSTLVGTALTTLWTGSVNWVGARKFWVVAVDVAGNYGTESFVSQTITVPGAPTSPTVAYVDGDVELKWAKPATGTLDVESYEVRFGSIWATATTVATVSALSCRVPVTWFGGRTFLIAAKDVNGNVGSAASVAATIIAHGPVQNIRLTAANKVLSLAWDASVVSGGRLPVKSYEVREGASWASAEVIAVTSGTNVQISPRQGSSFTFFVTATDIRNNEGATSGFATINVTPPAVVVPACAFVDGNAVLSWPEPAAGGIPIDKYEVRQGATWETGAYVASVTTRGCSIPALWLGSRDFHVAAIDWLGNVGPSGAVTAMVGEHTAVTSLNAVVLPDLVSVELSWGASTGSLPLSAYQVRHGDLFETAEIIAETKSTKFTVPANWVGTRKFWVVAIDTGDILGVETGKSVSVTTATAPGVSGTVVGAKLELSWTNAVGTLPIKNYEIREGASWAAGTPVAVADSNKYRVPITWIGSKTFWIVATDAAGNVGAAGRYVASIVAPSKPAINDATSLVGGTLFDQYRIVWSEVAQATNSLPIDHYAIGYDSTTLATLKGTTYSAKALWSGARVFWVEAVDVNGNVSARDSVTLTIAAPAAPTSFTTQVVDNNVLFYWSGAVGTLPIETYELAKESTFNASAPSTYIGKKAGGFTVAFETQAGTYNYYIRGIDTAGNAGTYRLVAATVNQPPDYILNANWDSTFGGTKSNAVIDRDGSLLLPANTTETWEQHFTANSWTAPQDQVTAGYPNFMMPTPASGYYEEVFDYGTVLAATKITITIAGTSYGSPTRSYQISTSLDGVTYSTPTSALSVYATNFRYVKIRITVTGSGANDQYDMTSLNLRLDSKIKNDSGSTQNNYCKSTDSGGTQINFNIPFVDITSINVTYKGTSAVTAVYDFVDAPNPTGFKVLLFNTAGARVTGDVSWSVKGY